MELARLSTGEMLSGKDIDANANRERTRQKRLRKWLMMLGAACGTSIEPSARRRGRFRSRHFRPGHLRMAHQPLRALRASYAVDPAHVFHRAA